MAKTKKTPELEYRILVTPQLNELRQIHTTLFLIETTKYFASFQYELSVSEQRTGRNIRYKVLGLKAPQLSLPAAGHAQFRREYEDLQGTYQVTIEGLDKRECTFTVSINSDKVRVTRAPAGGFVEVFDDTDLWVKHS